MISREMFTNEFKDFFAYVYLNIQAEGWIKPDYLSILISLCILGWFLEFQCCFVSTVFKCCDVTYVVGGTYIVNVTYIVKGQCQGT